MAENIMTIEKYLNGKVRNIIVPDDAIATFIVDAKCPAGTTKDTDISTLSLRDRELCLAWMYVWVSGSPTQTGSNSDEDADWRHTEGGERMSANVLKQYLAMANDIFDKYDEPLVGEDYYGFVGRGIRNPRIHR